MECLNGLNVPIDIVSYWTYCHTDKALNWMEFGNVQSTLLDGVYLFMKFVLFRTHCYNDKLSYWMESHNLHSALFDGIAQIKKCCIGGNAM